ncbi:NIMA (never in mitosis gene a)-related kinase [Mytilus galloprovincialis]|uniref:non-specific serine/threonine protein kinase n=1 Tax=Mytilus galloprovincialis TaxID=29158 RepID=A0A8B6GGA2_MYTGA|nr:NIMA (never in mitosis gene a)-related kinase [Mytilus galloprovincialis]
MIILGFIRQKGADAAERARIVGDFIQRKQEAEANRRRGNAELFGGAAPYESPRNVPPSPSPMRDDGRPSSADSRRREEEEYLERLKKIRQANYNERRNDKNNEAEVRKKKIEALRQQADDKARQLKEQLERQRREMVQKEERMRNHQAQRYAQGKDRPGSAPPVAKPVPAVGITGVLKAIGSEPAIPEPVQSPPGIGMTGALKAIGAQNSPEERPKSALQLKRDEVLKGVNQRGPPRAGWGALDEKPAFEIKEEEEPESPRSRWGDKIDDRLKGLPLQETASAMEATSARDQVILNPSDIAADAARRQWGRPGSTVMNALKDIPIMEGSSTMSSDKSDDSVPSSVASTDTEVKPGIGETITVTKTPIQKGTITISSIETKENITRPEIEIPSKPSESPDHEVNQSKSEPTIASSPDQKSTQSDTEKEPEKSSSEGQLSKPPVATKSVLNKPPLPSKPKPADKPLVLPKPTILTKPESPLVFAKQGDVPQTKNEVGAGSLFSKVELEETDKTEAGKDNLVLEEVQDDTPRDKVQDDVPKDKVQDDVSKDKVQDVIPKDKDGKPKTGLAVALTTGHFDMRYTGMLRTCSEPDLSKLSQKDVVKIERRSLELERLKEDDDDDDEEESSENKDKDDGENEEEEEDVDEEEYEELMSVRETMASLLLRECSTDDDGSNKGDTHKFRLSAASNKENDIEEENDDKNEDEEEEENKEDENDEDDKGDDNEEEENGDDGDVNNYAEALEDAEYKDDSALFESDESDVDTQFGDDDEDFDLFSRLEESRAELEGQLGCDKFLKVYKTVQALQEDEDENIEDGAKLAMNMLGKDQEHLYPKIFQLVMADAAFTEDNE